VGRGGEASNPLERKTCIAAGRWQLAQLHLPTGWERQRTRHAVVPVVLCHGRGKGQNKHGVVHVYNMRDRGAQACRRVRACAHLVNSALRDSWRAVSVTQRDTVSSSPPINLICTCRRCHALHTHTHTHTHTQTHAGQAHETISSPPFSTSLRLGEGLSTHGTPGEHGAQNLGRLLPSSYISPSAIPSPSSASPACAPSPTAPPSPAPSPTCTSGAHDEKASTPGSGQGSGKKRIRCGR